MKPPESAFVPGLDDGHTTDTQGSQLAGKRGRKRAASGCGPGAGSALFPRLLSVDGAARYLNVSAWTVRDMVAAGTLPRVQLPLGERSTRRLLFDRVDLDRIIERSKG